MPGWPSGLRRPTQVRFSSEAWGRIPLQAVCNYYFFLCVRAYINSHTQKNFIIFVITTPVRFELTRVEPIRFLI